MGAYPCPLSPQKTAQSKDPGIESVALDPAAWVRYRTPDYINHLRKVTHAGRLRLPVLACAGVQP